nr:polymorphic toxin type 10 domain-containing protein [Leptospira interrogans]
MKSALSAPTPVNAVVNSAVATGKGAKELYDNRKEVYASAKDFAGKLTSKDDKVRDYAVGQAKAYTMSAVLGGAASKALGSRLSLAKTKMWEVKSKITDSCDKMKLFEKKRAVKLTKNGFKI